MKKQGKKVDKSVSDQVSKLKSDLANDLSKEVQTLRVEVLKAQGAISELSGRLEKLQDDVNPIILKKLKKR